MEEHYFVGAMYDPLEGHVDPSGVTHAYAKAARMAGAEVYRNTWAHEIVQRADGTWDVVTEAGTINAEHIVNAGGLWAREVGRMCGIELPVLAMEHMYLLTEAVPGLRDWNESSGREGLHCMDFGGEIYMRQEGDGLLLGTYERAGVPWSELDTPWDFSAQLLTPDVDRIAPSLAVGFAHFPVFNDVGIKQVINGPFTFAPDGNPLIGPIRGQRGHWVACGVMAGLSQSGGVGLALANWMVDGDPGFDVWGMDVARFGDWANPRYTNAKVRENYSRRFRIAYPNEELPAGRPLQVSPIHGRLADANAVWGASYGLEHALWFQRPGEAAEEIVTLRRSNAFDLVGEECAAVRTGVGMIETTNFAKYEVNGPGARAWLDSILANRLPEEGRLALTPMLNHDGKLVGDFTVAALGHERFMVFGSGVAERYHERWFDQHRPDAGSFTVRSLRRNLCGLSIAGPRSRELLASVTDADVSAEGFPFLSIRAIDVEMVPALAGRITFTGDLGYELWVEAAYLPRLFDVLHEAGEPLGLRLFGGRALDSLRLEKSFGTWAREFRPIYTPYEAGLGWAVKPDKGDFIGRAAAAAQRESPPERRLVCFAVDVDGGAGADRATDVIGDEPIWHHDGVVGWVTSGGYAHGSVTSVAMGYVKGPAADAVDGFEIEILGERRPALRLERPLFDPTGARMRA
jgi:dimethylglycine dehydrogenase